MSATPPPSDRPYPAQWDDVAEIRVLRAPHDQWEQLTLWTADMRKKGWRLLRVTTEPAELVAVFGKTRRR